MVIFDLVQGSDGRSALGVLGSAYLYVLFEEQLFGCDALQIFGPRLVGGLGQLGLLAHLCVSELSCGCQRRGHGICDGPRFWVGSYLLFHLGDQRLDQRVAIRDLLCSLFG